MPRPESKPASPFRRPGWALAYAMAALALAGSLGLVWLLDQHRPWQQEVREINQRRGALVTRRLAAAGLDPRRAAARGAEVAARPPRVREITPQATGRPERCLTCHHGIAEISPSHPVEAVGCTSCHGGQALALTREAAHRGLLGRNPSRLAVAGQGCGGAVEGLAGRCHAGRESPAANVVARVERTIMATMTGVITSLRVAWGAQQGFSARYATAAVRDPSVGSPPPPGMTPRLLAIPGGPPEALGFPGLADEHWRKFCARCHLRAERQAGPSAHGAGCAACHGRREADGRYRGDDATIDRDEPGHAARHRLAPAPAEEACRRCHNRSARIGLNYRGWVEDENGRVPWTRGNPRHRLSGFRGVRRLAPDVHAEKGLTCIDCHTGREVMGDGHLYTRMRFQTEMRCATCHGAPGRPPRFGPPDSWARFAADYGPLHKAPELGPGSRLGLSAKGRPVAGLRPGPQGGAVLHLKSAPEKPPRPCTDISAEPGHALPGHRRLACQACHSRWAPQCYGCHDHYQPAGSLWDYAAGKPTPGRWEETRDLYRFAEPPLGVDSRGRIAPFVPGCQVLLTVHDQAGGAVRGKVRRILGQTPAGNGIISTPTDPHTTRAEVARCESCHQSPRRLGLGWGPRRLGGLAAERLSDLTAAGWPEDWTALVDGMGRPLQGQTHQGARPLNRRELARVLRFARCLPCHRRPADPVVQDPAKAYRRIGPGGDLEAKHRVMEEKWLSRGD